MPEVQSEAVDTAGQPLTRQDCDKAGMAWNDTANVCGAAAQAAEAMPEVQSEVVDTARPASDERRLRQSRHRLE
jgi:hypothetical protein